MSSANRTRGRARYSFTVSPLRTGPTPPDDSVIMTLVASPRPQLRRPGDRPDKSSPCALQGGDGCLIALDQLGDDGRIGLDRSGRAAGQRSALARVGERRDEIVTVEDGLQRVPDQRIASSYEVQEAGAARGRGQALGDVDEQPLAGLVHGCHGRQLPHGEPQGLHGVSHHLLMTDGDVDVILLVAGLRDGEQCRDRSALNDVEAVVDQAPLDVLRAAEVRFDPPPKPHEPHEPHDLRIRQRRLLLPPRVDRHFPRTASRQGVNGTLLGGDRLGR